MCSVCIMGKYTQWHKVWVYRQRQMNYVSGKPCDWKPSPTPRHVCVVIRANAYSLSSCANSSSWRRRCSSVSLLKSTLSSSSALSSSRIPISLRNLAATLPSSSAANDDPVHCATDWAVLLSVVYSSQNGTTLFQKSVKSKIILTNTCIMLSLTDNVRHLDSNNNNIFVDFAASYVRQQSP